MSQGTANETKLVDIADNLCSASSEDRTSVDDLLNAFGQRGFGPLILVFALIALSPIGAIPGASIVTGSIIILVAGQLLLNRNSPWVPARLRRVSVESGRVVSAMERIRPYLEKADTFIKARWQGLLDPPWFYAVPFLCVALAVTMYPLAIVPGGVAVPSSAIVFLSLGISSRDGLIIAIGLLVSTAALAFSIYLLI
jgi:hypothetical protein